MDPLILEKLLQNVVSRLQKQNEYLSINDKKDYPLIYRAVERINDSFRKEGVAIQKIDIQAPNPDCVEFSVNGSQTFRFEATTLAAAVK